MRTFPRPLAFAALMLALAAFACAIEINTAHLEFAKTYTGPTREDRNTRSFTPDQTVYCLVNVRDVKAPVKLEIVWVRVLPDEGDTPEAEVEVGREVRTLDADGEVTFALTPPETGWEKGPYRIHLYLEGDLEMSLDFKVK